MIQYILIIQLVGQFYVLYIYQCSTSITRPSLMEILPKFSSGITINCCFRELSSKESKPAFRGFTGVITLHGTKFISIFQPIETNFAPCLLSTVHSSITNAFLSKAPVIRAPDESFEFRLWDRIHRHLYTAGWNPSIGYGLRTYGSMLCLDHFIHTA